MTDTNLPDVTLDILRWNAVYEDMNEDDFTDQGITYIASDRGENSPEHQAAIVIRHIHEQMDAGRNASYAALHAAYAWRKLTTPTTKITTADLVTITRHYVAFYSSISMVVDEVMREQYRGLPVDDLTEEAQKKYFDQARKPHQIWLYEESPYMDNYGGIWVFDNPDRTHH